MRIAVPAVGIEPDLLEHLRRPAARRPSPSPPMPCSFRPSPTICADRHARREAAERILEHDLHLRAAAAAARRDAQALDVLRRRTGSRPRCSTRRSSARPSVVLPEPLSPTTPTVWPRAHRHVDAVDRLDVADGAPQQAAPGSGNQHPDVVAPPSRPARSARRRSGRPFGSAASSCRV